MNRDSPTSFMKYAKNKALRTPPKQQKSGGGRSSNPYINNGRGGGRNSGGYNQGGRGFKGRGNPNFVPDPWSGVDHAKPHLTPKAQEILEEIILRPGFEVKESDLTELTGREGDIIALSGVMMNIVDRIKTVKFVNKNVQGLRDRSRSQLIEATMSEDKLDDMIKFLKLGKWSWCNQHTPPAMFIDLIGDANSIFRRVDEANLKDKPKIIYAEIIEPYLKRHFTPSEAIKAIMKAVSKMDYSNMSNLATVKSAMCKYIWQSAGTGTRFEPLDLPVGMNEVLWNIATAPQIQEEDTTNNDSGPGTSFLEMIAKATEAQQSFDKKHQEKEESLNSYDSTDELEKGKSDETQKKNDTEVQTELNKKENPSTKLDGIEEVSQEGDNEGDIYDDPAILEAIKLSQESEPQTPGQKVQVETEREAPNKQGNESNNGTVEKAIEVFECSIDKPNDMIKLEQDILLTMDGEDLKSRIRPKLTSYLMSHYSTKGAEIAEVIMKLPAAGIASLITTEGKMREFLKSRGYSPSSNLDVASPSKVYGNHPLASNKIRQYHLRISQTNKSDEAEQITKTIVCKLMNLAKNMENHVLALCPFNLSSKESKIWHKEAVVKKIMGWSDYIGNIDHMTWQKKSAN
eukprot:scaffold11188_cov43-Cyclotella_meneghiniana.AAC.4